MLSESLNTNRRRTFPRLLLLLSLPLIFMLGCSLPEKPGDWSWDTHLIVPLGARTYGMWQMTDSLQANRNRGSGVGMNADSSLYFMGFQTLRVSFRDSLYLDPLSCSVAKPVTGILVPVNLNQTDHYSLGTLNPGIAAHNGETLDLTPHPLNATTEISFGSRVNAMTVDTGSVILVVTNTLNYGVSQLRIDLDNGSGNLYGFLNNESLPAGGQINRRISLQHGMNLGSLATLVLAATGDGGIAIHVDSTLGLTVRAVIDTIQAVPYYGIIPRQALAADSMFDYLQHQRLYLGIIDTGSVSVTFNNQTQLDDSVWLIFPNFVSQGGDTLVSRQFVPAHSSRSQVINLRSYTLRLGNTTPQLLALQMRTASIETPDSESFDGIGQFIQGDVSLSRLGLSYFEGVLDHLQLQIPSVGTSIQKPPRGWEAVQPTIVDGFVHLLPSPSIGATADTRVDISTYLGGAQIDTTTLFTPNVPLGTDSTYAFHNLAHLMTQYPDSMNSSGTLIISGPAQMPETQTINLEVEMRAPLEVILHPVHAPGDIEEVSSSDLKHIEGGTGRVRVWNRLPSVGHVFLVADSDSVNIRWNSTAIVDTVAQMDIPVSPIVNDRATGEAYAESTFVLSARTIELLKHVPFYTRLDILLPSTNGDTLIADGSDYIRVQIIADVEYHVNTGDHQ